MANVSLDQAVADILAKLQEIIPEETTWLSLPYGDGTGRRYMSIKGSTRKNVVLVNEFAEFKVTTVLSGAISMPWYELTKRLCSVPYEMFVMEDMWYTLGE